MESARLAQIADVPEIAWVAGLVVEELTPHRGGDVFVVNEGLAGHSNLQDRVANGDAVVGTYDDVVLGYGLRSVQELADGRLLGRLDALAVVAEARGSGIGEAMMNLLISQLADAGCVGVDSTALPGDRSTKNFFESFGLKARMLTVHRPLS